VEKRRYALRLAYDGGAFRGYQRQPGLVSVQGCLEEVLSHLGVRARLEAAARTDAGVHALEQVVSFSARLALDPAALRAEVNARTPAGLLCLDAARVPDRFGARASAVARTYVYLVGWPPPAGLAPYAWSLPDARAFPEGLPAPFDAAAARDALRRAVGEHDFAGFARRGEQTARLAVDAHATVRTLLDAEVLASDAEPLAALVLTGKGFLRAMVRNLAGAAVSAAVGAAPAAAVSEILADPARRWRGPRAPGWGLTLAKVDYAERPFAPACGTSRDLPCSARS
jgi:tRNA pseudouridine38-40 synthase